MDTTAQDQPYRDVARHHEARGSAVRYAIYFAPHPDSAWWKFGCAWLGRDPIANTRAARFALAPIDAVEWNNAYLDRITAEPRRYGFHATLKAPFRLRDGCTAHDVYRQASSLAQSLMAATLPPLQLRAMDGFVALGLDREPVSGVTANVLAVTALAAQCVADFDNLRAPPDAKELARRKATGLTPRQSNLLAEWGYPYVFQEYRFHLTLTGRLSADEKQRVMAALAPLVATLNAEPLPLDALAVYCQPERDAPFVVTRRYSFDGSVDIYRDDV